MQAKEDICFEFFMSRLKILSEIKNDDKTKISIVFYEATQTTCILKICKSRDLSSICEALKNLKNPNVAVVYDYVYANGNTYILEEKLSGITLEEALQTNGVCSAKKTAEIMISVCKGLSHFHNSNPPLVHNDIKPSNIYLCDDNNIKLFDFDTSRMYDEDKSRNTQLYLTEDYASPEHFGWGQTTPRSDIFSLGVTMHKLLTGKCLSAEKKMTYNGKLKGIIEKCICQEPDKRYQSADYLRFDLEGFLNSNIRKNTHKKIFSPVLTILCLFVAFLIFLRIISDEKDNKNLNISENAAIDSSLNINSENYNTNSAEAPLNSKDFSSLPQNTSDKKMESKYKLTGELINMKVLNDGTFVYLEENSNGCFLKTSFDKEVSLKNSAGSYTNNLIYDHYSDILYLLTRDMNSSEYVLYSLDENFNTIHKATLNAGDRTISGTYDSDLYASFFSDATMYCDVLENQFINSKNWSELSSIDFSVFSITNDKLYQLSQNDSGINFLQEIDFQKNIINQYEIPFKIEAGRWRNIIYNNNKNIFFVGRAQNKDYIYKFDGENFEELICLNDYVYYSSFSYGEWCVTSDAVYIHDTDSNIIKEFKLK